MDAVILAVAHSAFSMLTMSDTEFQQYRTLDFQELSLIEPLVDNGFLIPVYTDEFERYNYYKNGLLEFYPSFAHYTIALTTKCNARCFYCYDFHKNIVNFGNV